MHSSINFVCFCKSCILIRCHTSHQNILCKFCQFSCSHFFLGESIALWFNTIPAGMNVIIFFFGILSRNQSMLQSLQVKEMLFASQLN